MLGIYKKLYSTLDARERRRGALVLILLLLVGLAESAGVASVLPFMAVLATPKVGQTNRYLAAVYAWLGFSSPDHFLLFLGVFVFVVLVGTVITFAEAIAHPSLFDWSVAGWLLLTVVFANFAEAMAEGRGKAQAETLRRMRAETEESRSGQSP